MNNRLYLEVLLSFKPLFVFLREHPAPAFPGPVHTPGHFSILQGGEDFSALSINIKENLSGKSQPSTYLSLHLLYAQTSKAPSILA